MALKGILAMQAEISVIGYSDLPGEAPGQRGIGEFERRWAVAERELGAGSPLLATWHYWELIRDYRPLPRSRDIDPAAMPLGILPQLMMIDIEDGQRFKFRLVGSAIVSLAAAEWGGRYVDEVIGADSRDLMSSSFRMAIALKRPVFARMECRGLVHVGTFNSYLVLPFGEESIASRLLIVSCPQDRWLTLFAWRGSMPQSYKLVQASVVL